jgi:hypothetical protein
VINIFYIKQLTIDHIVFFQALAEQKRKGKDESPALLNTFLDSADEKVQLLEDNFKLAQVNRKHN